MATQQDLYVIGSVCRCFVVTKYDSVNYTLGEGKVAFLHSSFFLTNSV